MKKPLKPLKKPLKFSPLRGENPQNLKIYVFFPLKKHRLFLYAIVLENKKTEGNLDIKALQDIALERNRQCFIKPMKVSEAKAIAKSVKLHGYHFKCPPKHNELTPICNKELCKTRKLGIGPQVPEMIDEFENINHQKILVNIGMTQDDGELPIITGY